MSEKILIANRGNQPYSGTAAQPLCAAAAGSSKLAAEVAHV